MRIGKVECQWIFTLIIAVLTYRYLGILAAFISFVLSNIILNVAGVAICNSLNQRTTEKFHSHNK